jgi:hypothetical protein
MGWNFSRTRRNVRVSQGGPRIEAMEPRVLFSFVLDTTNSTISAAAGAGGSFQQENTNPSHAQDSSSFAGNDFQPAYAKTASANASYQAAPLQLTLHGDAAVTDNSSYPTSEAQAPITLFFSLTSAAPVQFVGTLTGVGGGGSSMDLDSFSLGDFPVNVSSATTSSVHQTLNLSAGNYAIDFSAACNSGTVNGSASIDMTVTIGDSTPPQITSPNAVTFQIGKPSSFTIKTTGNPTPSITETAILPDGISFVDNGDGTATLSGTPSALDAQGHYDLIFTASNGVALNATQPNANQFFTLNLTGSAVKLPLPATHLVFAPQPTNTVAGATMPPVTVLVEDKTGHIVATDSSTISLTLGGTAGGILNGTTTLGASGGVATFSDLSLTKAGVYTLTATDGALRPARSRLFTINPDASTAHLLLPPTGTTTVATGKPFSSIAATVEDQFGNIIKKSNTTVMLVIASGPATGAIKGKATAHVTNGVAIFKNISLSPAGQYILQLSDSALPGDGSLPLNLAINAT